MTPDPHASQPVRAAGVPLDRASGAIILLHGRGGSADDIIGLGSAIVPTGWALLAPEAAGRTWYPLSFLAPREQNEPYVTSALKKVQSVLDLALSAGIPLHKVAVAGFSQGACLATEFVGRNPQRYGALLSFTGGLIGPLTEQLSLAGDLQGTSALLSSGDPDPHVPWERVQQSGELLQSIGANLTLRRYPGRRHTILPEEIQIAKTLLT